MSWNTCLCGEAERIGLVQALELLIAGYLPDREGIKKKFPEAYRKGRTGGDG